VAAEKTPWPSLVYLGSRKSRKRGDLALELWKGLRAEIPDLRLTYVGPAAEVADLASRPEYRGVEFLSRLTQEQLIGLYRKSWIYLCLSSYEGFGVGIIEAMAYSCLVVTAPHPGSEYLVKDGETGVMAPPEEAGALIARMLRDEKSRREIVRKAREFSRRFSPATVASSYLDLYRVAQARAAGAA
jgi:glycosyltransferase involved in cell wall biosynthesis